MARILVIEDEAILRSTVVRGLAKLGVEVDDAGTLDGALNLLDARTPDLIVSDIDLPHRSGLELLGELGRRVLNVPVVFVSGYLNAYRSQIPQHANVEVFEKPISIEDLREVVSRRLHDSKPGIEVAPFSLADYVQLACMGRHSVRIDIEREGHAIGTVVVVSGELWSAQDGSGQGEAAFQRLVFAKNAVPRCHSFSSQPPPRDVEGSWEWVLMEAARQADEEERSSQRFEADEDLGRTAQITPPFEDPAPSPPPPDPREQEFKDAYDRGIDALLAKRFADALVAFRTANDIKPDHPSVLANIQRLEELGHGTPNDVEDR